MRRVLRFFSTAVLLSAALLCRAALPPPPALDEAKIRGAMTGEILFRIVQKHLYSDRADIGINDYLTVQAYAAVSRLLKPYTDEAALRTFLGGLLEHPSIDPAIVRWRESVDSFSQGMTLEIVQSLLNEFDEAGSRLTDLEFFNEAVARMSRPPANLLPLLKRCRLTRRLVRRAAGAEMPADSGVAPFVRYGRMKKELLGEEAHPGLVVLFNLGARHAQEYPFIDIFMSSYEGLFRDLVTAAKKAWNTVQGGRSEIEETRP